MIKSVMKKKAERELLSHIDYNISRVKIFNKIDLVTYDSLDSSIYMCYNDDYLEKLRVKYGVNEELIKQVQKTSDEARDIHNLMTSRVQLAKANKKENDNIDLFKKAILELKAEGKL